MKVTPHKWIYIHNLCVLIKNLGGLFFQVQENCKILYLKNNVSRRECINRVCEVAAWRPTEKPRYVDRKLVQHIASEPHMEHSGSNVSLTVSSSSLTLVNLDTGHRIATHDMPRISFASGGDTVSYKSHVEQYFLTSCINHTTMFFKNEFVTFQIHII